MAANVVLLSPAVAGIIFGQGFWAVWTNFCHGFSRSAEYVWQILATSMSYLMSSGPRLSLRLFCLGVNIRVAVYAVGFRLSALWVHISQTLCAHFGGQNL